MIAIRSRAVRNEGRHLVKVVYSWEFPGSPVLKAPHFHCRGHGFDPWSGN